MVRSRRGQLPLEAVRALSFFNGADVPRATNLTYSALKKPTDYYLDYTTKETLRQLEPDPKDLVIPNDPKVLDALIAKLSDSEISRAPGVEPILDARVERKGIDANTKSRALQDLAKLH